MRTPAIERNSLAHRNRRHPRVVAGFAIAVALSCAGCLFGPVAWSPDGKQFVFLAEAQDADSIITDEWMFGRAEAGQAISTSGTGQSRGRCQLWLATVDSKRLQLVDETAGSFSVPAWAPDGGSLVYTWFEPSDKLLSPGRGKMQSGVLRLIRRYRDGKREALHEKKGDFSTQQLTALALQQSVWSPNGLYLATPWGGEQSLIVYSFASREIVAGFFNAYLPSWSPDSEKLCYLSDPAAGFAVTEVGSWSGSQRVIELSGALQPAIWDRGGAAIYVARGDGQGSPPFEPARRTTNMEILRVSVPDGGARTVQQFELNTEARDKSSGAYFAFDEASESILFTVLQEDLPAMLHQAEAESRVRKRSWHPLDDEVADNQIPIGGLSVAPGGRYLALRYGAPEWSAPVGLFDLTHNRLETWAPNDATRLRALWAIAEAAKRIVRKLPREAQSPFRLGKPIPADQRRLGSNAPAAALDLFDRPASQASRDNAERASIERLASHGLALLRSAPPPSSATVRRRYAELELFFRYIRADYEGALSAVSRLEWLLRPDDPPDRAAALDTIRIQCQIALGQTRQAYSRIPKLLEQRAQQRRPPVDSDEYLEMLLLGVDDADLGPRGQSLGQDSIAERLRSLLDAAEQLDK